MSKRSTLSENKMPSKILGIQFSILSPEEIENGSVAAIVNRDTYINNKPVIGGLFDPRMGVLDPGLVCPTDGLNYMDTPGYFGHIKLARPLFYIQYLTIIMKIMRCICFKCSKLKISKETYKHANKMPAHERWNFIFSIASKIKRCGEETTNGCGCLQPFKIKKEGLATIIAEWDSTSSSEDESKEKITMTLTPEIILKIFRRISDEDVAFMGFSPAFSRPDWMICQVLAVPPPAVRPSVKHDAQQRSEDDLSHIIVNIIKANKTLLDKIQGNASANVINDWTAVLQYYIATLVDNKIPGNAPVAQRSGRPLKSIKERLNGKAGRVRGNLMGKRVDFSARSVITPDPNLSIRELGVPIEIAKNLTKPVKVNKRTRGFLTKLVKNGPDEYPGAKILEKKNGDSISLRYIDRESIKLENGDIVHRHIMNGDVILFNRQPTLHRMSMMCHYVRIMNEGKTFRMNVGCTKPYNADFDGDEMNLHQPQDPESESELRNLAAVTWQLISPANNKSIVGIFQDSLLGSYRFTRKDIHFTPKEAMNLLMNFSRVNVDEFPQGEIMTNFDIISQILPPMSLKYKTKRFKDEEDYAESNNVLEIKNGKYLRGQIEKGVYGDDTKGLIQRITNDFGNHKAADFIDDIQNIITEYMKTSAYSVGISDLIADQNTNEKIAEAITKKKQDVKSLIDQTHLGIFENKTGKSNEQEFETQVNNILNAATNTAGKIGRESLDKNNRFLIMVNAGSKGSDLNISQMISCLGQQNVDGKRIPYGFKDRTLPHFTKFDDSPSARGFVESSFISGLTPEELFFHAMGGRIGIIDTAVKTSQTGYIQRRLIKSMEDLKVEYDMTVRNNKNKIIQFSYGDSGFDTTKYEKQFLNLMEMTMDEIYAHFDLSDPESITPSLYTDDAFKRMKKQNSSVKKRCKSLINMMIQKKKEIIEEIFGKRDNKALYMPISFTHVINNIYGQNNLQSNSMTDITPGEAYEMIDAGFERLNKIHLAKPTELFKVMYYFHLNPKDLLIKRKFNKLSLSCLIHEIETLYKKALVAPGEMVGMIAAQSIGEPTTQMTLNTFHFAGVASKSNVTRGVPRIEEILSLSDNPKNPSCTIHLKKHDEDNQEKAKEMIHYLEHTKLVSIVDSVQIYFDPDDESTLIQEDENMVAMFNEFEKQFNGCIDDDVDEKEKSKWIIRMEMNAEEMFDRGITMDDVNFAIHNSYGENINCIYSDYNSDKLVFRLRIDNILAGKKKDKPSSLDQSDEIYLLKNLQDDLLNKLILRGINKIEKVIPRKIIDTLVPTEDSFEKKETWVLDTVGSNLLEILSLNMIDVNRSYTNDIQEIYRVLGIEAARQAIFNEISEVLAFDSTYINYHHLNLLCDRMTCKNSMVSVFRHGINNDDIGPLAKASFEETPEMFLKAARHAELDPMRGVSANVMCGQEGFFGTSAFQVILDLKKFSEINEEQWEKNDEQDKIENAFQDIYDSTGVCSAENLQIQSNINSIEKADITIDDDYDLDF